MLPGGRRFVDRAANVWAVELCMLKLLGEFLAVAYWREKHLHFVARLFNTVGPRQQAVWNGVARFVQAALRDEPITIHGDGSRHIVSVT
jgi:nucleoside-diphosphate-sugar epimerase